MRTAASIPPPGPSSTAIVRQRPRGSHATVVRGRVRRRDGDGLLTGGGRRGSRAQGGRRRGRSGRVRGVEQAPAGEDRAHHGRVLHRGDAPQPAATAGAGEDIEIEHAAHQGGPGPRARSAGGAGAGLALARRGVRGRAAVADDVRAPASMGSRYILLRDRKTSPSTTAGTHSTARLPASIAAYRLPTASCCFANCRTARETHCPRG
jgi:hypothetical protein